MGKARKIYRKTRDYENLTRVLEKEQKYSEVVAEWDKIDKRFDALEKAKEYEMNGYVLDKNMCAKELASKYAKLIFAQKKRRNEELVKVVQYLPLELRLKNLKLAGLFEEALDVHLGAGQHKQAERLMSAQGFYNKAIKLAKKRGDKETEASFKFQQALSLIHKEPETFSRELKEQLNYVSKCGFVELEGHAHLLLAKITRQKTSATSARIAFQRCINIVGELESFYQLLQCGQNLQQYTVIIIRSCSDVNRVVKSLRTSGKKTASDDKNIKQALTFYHIYKEGKEYVLSEHLNLRLHVDELKSHYSSHDEDGMVKLQPAIVCQIVADHLELIMKNLLRKSVVNELQDCMKRYHFHTYIRDRHCLLESLLSYPFHILRNYLETIEHMLAVKAIDDKLMTENPSGYLIALLSPSINWFLPFSKQHYRLMAQSKHISNVLGKKIQDDIDLLQISEPAKSYRPSADSLLDAWKACSIIGQTSKLSNALKNDAKQYLQEEKLPYHMIDRRQQDDLVYHFFQYWLEGCSLIRQGYVASAIGIIYAFLLKISRRWSLDISVVNSVDIATVCTIGLISTISLVNPGYHLLIPRLYAHVVKIFDDFNTQDGGGRRLLDACFTEISSCKRNNYSLRELETRCTNLLFNLLKLMLGYSVKKHMLRNALSRRNTDGSAVYCLELCTVLVANLTIISPYRREELSDCLAIMCRELNYVVCSGTIPQGNYIAEAHRQLSSANNVGKLFHLSQYLSKLHSHNPTLCIVLNSFRQGKNMGVSFVDTPIPLHLYRQTTFKPTASFSNRITTSSVQVQSGILTQQESSPSSHAIPIIHPDSTKHRASVAQGLFGPGPDGSNDQESPSIQQHETETAPDTAYIRQDSTGEFEEDTADLELDEESARMMKERVYEPDTKPLNEKPTSDDIMNIDRSIVDEQFCGVCGEHLQEEQANLPAIDDEEEAAISPSSPPQSPTTRVSSSPPLTSQATRQTLKEHVKCTSHKEKACAHKAFTEVELNQYAPLKEKMEEFLSRLTSIEQLNSEQETLCETCRQCLHRERELDDHKSKYEWREAYTSITYIIEEMDSLCKRLDCAIEDLIKENQILSMIVEESENGNDHSSKDVPQKDEEEDEEEKEDERAIEYYKQPSENVSQRRKKVKRKRMKG